MSPPCTQHLAKFKKLFSRHCKVWTAFASAEVGRPSTTLRAVLVQEQTLPPTFVQVHWFDKIREDLRKTLFPEKAEPAAKWALEGLFQSTVKDVALHHVRQSCLWIVCRHSMRVRSSTRLHDPGGGRGR